MRLKCNLSKIKIFTVVLVLTLAILGQISAQQRTIEGTVTDNLGSPLPGVTVVVKGTTIGSVTNVEGNFSLAIPDGAQVLQFSFVGMRTQEISIEGKTTFRVVMEEETIGLDEVIAIGYRVQQKASLTGSVSTVDSDKLKNNPVGSLEQALQGIVSGVRVTKSNQPGGSANVRVRGLGTINNNNPLWVIDGIPKTGGINEINPANIESITVLKDASSTAIYGARGANGVILVTTIQGSKDQEAQFNFNVRYGISRNTAKYDLLDSEEYGEMLWLQAKNSGVPPSHPIYGSGDNPRIPRYILPAGADEVDLSLYNVWTYPITEANLKGTDWHNEIFNPAAETQEYNFSVSGGGKSTTYSFNGGVLKEEGIVRLTGFDRYTLGLNVNSVLNKWLEIGQNLQLSHINNYGHQSAGENGAMAIIPQLTPLMPVHDIMGNYAPLSRLNGFDPLNNPVGDMERGRNFDRKTLGLIGNVNATVSILEDFNFKTLLGFYTSDRRNKSPLEANPDSYQARSEHQLTESSGISRQLNWTNTLNYSKTFDNHKIQILLGTEAIDYYTENTSALRTGFLLTDDDYWVLDAGSGMQTNSGSASDWALYSYFGHIHYSYNQKYLFDLVMRRDGSSRFSKTNRYGNFPAISLGWILSEENFLISSKDWLDFLKLRISYGKSGNDQIGNYNAFSTYRTDPWYSNYPIDGSNNSLTTGFESLAFGNPTAKWETTTALNFGVDAYFFNKLQINLDLWHRETTDMLFPKAIPGVVGMASAPSVNIGSMTNKGIDIEFNYQDDINNDLKYNISLDFSKYSNEITRLSDRDDEAIIGSAYRGYNYLRSEIGTSFPEFYGYIVEGIFQTDEEVNNHPPAFGSYNSLGRFKFKDVNDDGVIDENDRTYMGSPHPDFTMGLTASIQYNNFYLNTTLYASVGNEIANIARRYTDFNMFQRNRSKRRLYESWGSPYLKDNKDAKMPIAELNDAVSHYPSTYFIEDGSFLRLQTLEIGYDFPLQMINWQSIKNLRVFAMATNLVTFTKYSGLDPEINTGDRQLGEDLGVWPSPQRFQIGLNLSF